MHALLAVVHKALREGDEDAENAVAVSFVEDTGWWEPAMRTFITTWPDGLKAEAESSDDRARTTSGRSGVGLNRSIASQ
jgi:hypothetical protein